MTEIRKSREDTKRETRQALLDAGLKEMVEHGMDVPSLDSICARAGYTRGAFYVHFKDREDLQAAILEWVLGRFMQVIVTTNERGDDLEQSVRAFVRALQDGTLPAESIQLLHSRQLMDPGARSEVVHKRLIELDREAVSRLAKAALRGQEAGTVRPDVDGDQLAALLFFTAMGSTLAKQMGFPLDLQALQNTVLCLIAPTGPTES